MARVKAITKVELKKIQDLRDIGSAQHYEVFEADPPAKKARILLRKLRAALALIAPEEGNPNANALWIDQVLTSADSIYANLAEGWGRWGTNRLLFIRYARGSAFETLAHLQTAPIEVQDELLMGYRKLCRMLTEEVSEHCQKLQDRITGGRKAQESDEE